MSVNLSTSARGSVPATAPRSDAIGTSPVPSGSSPGATACVDKPAGAPASADASFAALPTHGHTRLLDRSEFGQSAMSGVEMDQRYAVLGGVPAPAPSAIPPGAIEGYARTAFQSVLKLADRYAADHLHRLAEAESPHDDPAIGCFEEKRVARFLMEAEKTLVDLARTLRQTELPPSPTPAMERLLNVSTDPIWGQLHGIPKRVAEANDATVFQSVAASPSPLVQGPAKALTPLAKSILAPSEIQRADRASKAKPSAFFPVYLVRLITQLAMLRLSQRDPFHQPATAHARNQAPESTFAGKPGAGAGAGAPGSPTEPPSQRKPSERGP